MDWGLFLTIVGQALIVVCVVTLLVVVVAAAVSAVREKRKGE